MAHFKCWDVTTELDVDAVRGIETTTAQRAAEMAGEYWWWLGAHEVSNYTVLVEDEWGNHTAWEVTGQSVMEFSAAVTSWSPPSKILAACGIEVGGRTWRDSPGIQEALKERRPDEVSIVHCEKCGGTSYYNDGSHATCEWCGLCLDHLLVEDSVDVLTVDDAIQAEADEAAGNSR